MATGTHAIVFGAGIAGLAAARVLAERFDRVTVVERDELPEGPELRPGVPQARCIHVLRLGGQSALFRLFPELECALDRDGVPRAVVGAETEWFAYGGWKKHCFDTSLAYRPCTRPFLEWHVRRQLAGDRRVTIRDRVRVDGLRYDEHRRRVVGVTGEGTDALRAAELVVDATGRLSRAPEWLRALGRTAPREIVVDGGCSYVSARLRGPVPRDGSRKLLLMLPSYPEFPYLFFLQPIEKARWFLTIGAWNGERLPHDADGFVAFARGLPGGRVAEALAELELEGEPFHYRLPGNRWRAYEKLHDLPDGFVVLGDAACSLNPVFGQGMTTGVRGAVLLGERVARRSDRGERLRGLAPEFQRRLAMSNYFPWLLASGEDRKFPGTSGGSEKSLVERLSDAYMRKMMIRCGADRDLAWVLTMTGEMMMSPLRLYAPSIVARVLLPLGDAAS